MEIVAQPFKDCYLIQPDVYHDERGKFIPAYVHSEFEKKTEQSIHWALDNQSHSTRGVLRGLHFQKGSAAQAKLIQVVKGSIQDVIVDCRTDSDTYGNVFHTVLDSNNHQQLFVPRGMAHGFLVLEDDTIVSYKCDNYYDATTEGGIIYNDPDLDIDWLLDESQFIVSEKDQLLPSFKSLSR